MSPVLNSGAFFDVDVSEVQKFGYVLKGSQARGIINKELHDAGQRSGFIVRDKANALTNRRTGRLIETSTVHTSLNSSAITTTVTWPAKSPRGFGYPYVVNYGRGPVVAKAGGVLRFEVGGTVLFRKSVGPAKAQHFAERGLEAAGPRIIAEHQKAQDAIIRKVEAL
jgi:hypothetical protein